MSADFWWHRILRGCILHSGHSGELPFHGKNFVHLRLAIIIVIVIVSNNKQETYNIVSVDQQSIEVKINHPSFALMMPKRQILLLSGHRLPTLYQWGNNGGYGKAIRFAQNHYLWQ